MLQRQQSYPYEQLPQGDVFRYLILQPGAEEDPLICNLRTADIAATAYEAVSYVWGTSNRDYEIECDGHLVMITPSLSKVLRRVRQPAKPVALWADSICINQDDNNDKGHQVGLMGNIYRSAQRVQIYIGSEDDNHGSAVCSLLDDVDDMIQDACKRIDMSWDSFPELEENDPLLDDPRWGSLRVLLSQNWFDRGWVVQEAALALHGELIWGCSRLDWEILMRVYLWLSTRGGAIHSDKDFREVQINAHLDVYIETHRDFARLFYSEEDLGSPSILRTLKCAKELDLSNPRDRIYAFMELPQFAGAQIKIRADYAAPYLEAYKRFAIEYTRATRSTEILDYVSHDAKSLGDDVPSWVPRWDIITWSLSQNLSTSAGLLSRALSTPEPYIEEEGSLRVRGVIMDTVQYVSELFNWDTTTPETVKTIWESMNALQIPSPYAASSTGNNTEAYILDAFLDALSVNNYEGDYQQWRQAREQFALGAELKQKLSKALRRSSGSTLMIYDTPVASMQDMDILTDDDHTTAPDLEVFGADGDANAYFNYIRSRTNNRHFVLTSRGYMGMAPTSTRAGDLCGIVFGTTNPCILRRTGTDNDSHYKLLGATTLQGKACYEVDGDGVSFYEVLGDEDSKDWVEWDVEEQDIWLC